RVRDLTHHFVLREIDNHDFARVGHVKFPCGRIDRQIIPAAFATDWDALEQLVILTVRCLQQREEHEADEHPRFHLSSVMATVTMRQLNRFSSPWSDPGNVMCWQR